MTDAFILGGTRTPLARYGGSLSHLRLCDPLGMTMRGACEHVGAPLEQVEDIIARCVNVARWAALNETISDSDHVAAAKVLRRSRIHIPAKRRAEQRPSAGRDNGANSSGHRQSEVVLVLSGAVYGKANRLRDAIMIIMHPALGALAFKFGPGRHGEPLEERVGLSDTVIQPPTMATRSQP